MESKGKLDEKGLQRNAKLPETPRENFNNGIKKIER